MRAPHRLVQVQPAARCSYSGSSAAGGRLVAVPAAAERAGTRAARAVPRHLGQGPRPRRRRPRPLPPLLSLPPSLAFTLAFTLARALAIPPRHGATAPRRPSRPHAAKPTSLAPQQGRPNLPRHAGASNRALRGGVARVICPVARPGSMRRRLARPQPLRLQWPTGGINTARARTRGTWAALLHAVLAARARPGARGETALRTRWARPDLPRGVGAAPRLWCYVFGGSAGSALRFAWANPWPPRAVCVASAL